MKTELWEMGSESYHEGRRMEYSPLKFRASRLRYFFESAIVSSEVTSKDFPSTDISWRLNFMGRNQEETLKPRGDVEEFMEDFLPKFRFLGAPPLFYSIAEELYQDFQETKARTLTLKSWAKVDRHWEMVGGFLTSRAAPTPVFETLRPYFIACAEARDAAFENFTGELIGEYLDSVSELSLHPNYFLFRNHMAKLYSDVGVTLNSLEEIQELRDELEVEGLWKLHTTPTLREELK